MNPIAEPVEVLSLQQFSKVILEDLADPFQTMRDTWIFRGQADSTWLLEPQLLRAEFNRWAQLASWHDHS